MSKKMYGILGVLTIVIVGFIALQIYLHIDMKNFKNEIAGSTKVQTIETTDVVFSDEKPDDIPGFEWVRHDDHWDKVSINEPIQPIEPPPVDIVEVSNENAEALKDSELAAKYYEGKLSDADFYREYIKLYSKEQLKANIESAQKHIHFQRTEYIPQLEESYRNSLKWIQDYPILRDSPDSDFMKHHNLLKTQLNGARYVLKRTEEKNKIRSKVLNEEVNNDKK